MMRDALVRARMHIIELGYKLGGDPDDCTEWVDYITAVLGNEDTWEQH